MMIVFTSTKGGTTKSTLSSLLAIWLFDRGQRVALLDCDKQCTSLKWVSTAEPSIVVRASSDMEEIRTIKKELEQQHDFIVADTPGEECDASRTATLLSDLAVIPLQPSLPDLRAIKDALKTIRLAQEMTGGKPEYRFVITLTAKGDVKTRSLREQLESATYPVAKSEIRRLNTFRDACDSSPTRMGTPQAREASRDMDALFSELLGRYLVVKEKQAAN